MFDFDYWKVKIIFDLLGYLSALFVTWLFYKKIFRKNELPNPWRDSAQKKEYLLYVLTGAMLGAMVISTFDGAMIPGRSPEGGILLSKSIAGALFGGVITAEIYKYFYQIKVPTGILFLPGIVIGVLIGRFGAIATGLRDFTYGLPTSLPWGVDFGDGIARHPTMIYEILLLTIFFVIFIFGLYSTQRKWWIRNSFYLFVIIYFLYRFLVGFIQPYSHFWFGLSTYQLIAIPMVIYGWQMTFYSK